MPLDLVVIGDRASEDAALALAIKLSLETPTKTPAEVPEDDDHDVHTVSSGSASTSRTRPMEAAEGDGDDDMGGVLHEFVPESLSDSHSHDSESTKEGVDVTMDEIAELFGPVA